MLAAAASLVAIALIALPVLGLRLGASDSSTDPASWTTRQSYDALASGFGPGFNGPLELAGQVRSPAGINLISVVAALGAITAVFTRGWGGSLLGLSGTGPVDAFLPVVMFSVLFGLSTDYEVYTVSRTRIVTAAAGIMILVFGSFLPGGHHLLQEFGFGLGFSVLVDALLIRSMLLPAVTHLIGPANWYLPARLSRILPRLDIEAAETSSPGETEASAPGPSEAADSSRTR